MERSKHFVWPLKWFVWQMSLIQWVQCFLAIKLTISQKQSIAVSICAPALWIHIPWRQVSLGVHILSKYLAKLLGHFNQVNFVSLFLVVHTIFCPWHRDIPVILFPLSYCTPLLLQKLQVHVRRSGVWWMLSAGDCGECFLLEHVVITFCWSMWWMLSAGACGECFLLEHYKSKGQDQTKLPQANLSFVLAVGCFSLHSVQVISWAHFRDLLKIVFT